MSAQLRAAILVCSECGGEISEATCRAHDGAHEPFVRRWWLNVLWGWAPLLGVWALMLIEAVGAPVPAAEVAGTMFFLSFILLQLIWAVNMERVLGWRGKAGFWLLAATNLGANLVAIVYSMPLIESLLR